MTFPAADLILVAIAIVLVVLSARGYRREGRLASQHKTWLTVAGIFVAVVILLRLTAR